MSGKGDKPRPMNVPRDEFNKKWDKIDWTKRKKNNKKEKIVKNKISTDK